MARAGDPGESFTGAFGGVVTFNWAPSPIISARQLEGAADRLNNMTAPLMAARNLGIKDVAENFAGEHDPDGVPWQEWSESYIASGPPGPPLSILHLTGDLEASSTDPSAWPITARELFFSFGALPEYGIWHQEGASRISAGRGVSREEARKRDARFIGAGFDIFAGKGAAPEYGQSLHANPLPARPFAGISVETQFAIIDIFDAWFSATVSLFVSGSGVVQQRLPSGRFGPRL